MNDERNVIVLGKGEGEPVWFVDHFCTLKARSSDGAPFGVLEVQIAKGGHTPFHRHNDEDEAFYVLEGQMTIFLEGGRTIVGHPGSYVHFPKGAAHGFHVDETVKLLVICGPNGFVEFVTEAGMPAPRRELPPDGPPDLPKLEKAAQKYRIDLLGPLPG